MVLIGVGGGCWRSLSNGRLITNTSIYFRVKCIFGSLTAPYHVQVQVDRYQLTTHITQPFP